MDLGDARAPDGLAVLRERHIELRLDHLHHGVVFRKSSALKRGVHHADDLAILAREVGPGTEKML